MSGPPHRRLFLYIVEISMLHKLSLVHSTPILPSSQNHPLTYISASFNDIPQYGGSKQEHRNVSPSSTILLLPTHVCHCARASRSNEVGQLIEQVERGVNDLVSKEFGLIHNPSDLEKQGDRYASAPRLFWISLNFLSVRHNQRNPNPARLAVWRVQMKSQ